jgi:DNA polymerase III sliding clamp (beta) subunit (PCNA family)
MKFQAQLSGLRSAFEPAILVANTGVKRDYDDGFKISFSADADKLHVEANNGNVAIVSPALDLAEIQYQSHAAGSATVNATDLAKSLDSFASDEIVQFELSGTMLEIRPLSDLEQVQAMPTEANAVAMPNATSSFNHEIEVKRETFIYAMKKVTYAVGTEKFQEKFLYWVFRIKKNAFRAACGDGGRFAIYEIEGADVIKSDAEFNIHVSKEHNAVLQKLLELGNSDKVTIREYSKGKDNAVPDQIVVSIDGVTVTLIGHNADITWPDESIFLNRASNFKYITALSDWEQPLRGINATNNDTLRQQSQPHYANLTFDAAKKVIIVKADQFMKSLRKTRIKDSWDDGTDMGDFSFNCLSQYMGDMFKYGDSGDSIQIEIVAANKPAVIRYYAGDKVADGPLYKTNATTGTREQYVMLIAQTPKK